MTLDNRERERIGSGGRGRNYHPVLTPLLSLSHDDHTASADVHEYLFDDDDDKTIEKDQYLFS